MKRVLSATCLALVCAVAVSAQSADQSQDKPKPQKPTTGQTMDEPSKPTSQDQGTKPGDQSRRGQARGAASVTLTGCLAAGDTPNAFMLTDVKADTTSTTASKDPAGSTTYPGNPPTTPTTPPTAGTPPSSAQAGAMAGSGDSADGVVRLIGSPAGMDLKAHVGHTVRVTGAWAPRDGGRTGAAGTAGTTGTAGATAGARARSVNVKNVEHVSATCPAK